MRYFLPSEEYKQDVEDLAMKLLEITNELCMEWGLYTETGLHQIVDRAWEILDETVSEL